MWLSPSWLVNGNAVRRLAIVIFRDIEGAICSWQWCMFLLNCPIRAEGRFPKDHHSLSLRLSPWSRQLSLVLQQQRRWGWHGGWHLENRTWASSLRRSYTWNITQAAKVLITKTMGFPTFPELHAIVIRVVDLSFQRIQFFFSPVNSFWICRKVALKVCVLSRGWSNIPFHLAHHEDSGAGVWDGIGLDCGWRGQQNSWQEWEKGAPSKNIQKQDPEIFQENLLAG